MRKLTRVAAAAALVAFGVGASATAADAMLSGPPERLCGAESLVATVQDLPVTLGGPYVLNLQSICLAP